jgi:hypothetical protein
VGIGGSPIHWAESVGDVNITIYRPTIGIYYNLVSYSLISPFCRAMLGFYMRTQIVYHLNHQNVPSIQSNLNCHRNLRRLDMIPLCKAGLYVKLVVAIPFINVYKTITIISLKQSMWRTISTSCSKGSCTIGFPPFLRMF